MTVAAGRPVVLLGKMRLGFLLSAGTCGEVKSYGVFTFDEQTQQHTFNRFCTPFEKKILKKLVYYERLIQSIRAPLSTGDSFLLFVGR